MRIDVIGVAAVLASRFGIEMLATEVSIDGGRWPAVRPALPAEPNGFSIVLAATLRRVVAVFHPDRFSGQLLAAMADAEPAARAAAAMYAGSLDADGIKLLATLDGVPMRAPGDLLNSWSRLELECEQRFARASLASETATIAVASACLGLVLALLPLEEEVPPVEQGLPEGALIRTFVNRYERSPTNRARCIAHFGARCQACGFDFEDVYGSLGANFIEVHHLTMVSQMGGSYTIDPIRDLVPLCANCHAMVHRRTPPLTVGELRAVIASTTEVAN